MATETYCTLDYHWLAKRPHQRVPLVVPALWQLTLSDNLICSSIGIIATSIFEITLIRRPCAR